MAVTGMMFIGGQEVRGEGGTFQATAASEGSPLDPQFFAATAHQLDLACALAASASDAFAQTSPAERAALLEAIAANISGLGDELIERCMAESGLPRPRLAGEQMRTVNQLKAFATLLRSGKSGEMRIDPADPTRQPAPKPDLRLAQLPIGPVAVFSASNFPLAFSVAGGDTAAALAAGCPVIVKAHSAHPGTSELIARAVRDAILASGLPAGIFSLLFDDGYAIGQALVADPRIKAVGFTGSRKGGLALMDIAARRPEPIPVYAEMSSINPVILMPGRLESQAETIASGFVAGLTLGAGQFCTNPGLVLALAGPALDRFIAASASILTGSAPAKMLTANILSAYRAGVKTLQDSPGVSTVASGIESAHCGQSQLFVTDSATFLASSALQEEVFGASSLVVRCGSRDELHAVLEALEGQLTIAVHMDPDDYEDVRSLLPTIARKAGRIIANGFGTGVEVSPAMVHGGPFPATSDGRSTSVGTLAIERFQRPVCYQDIPDALLPPALQEANPWGVVRAIY